MSVFIPEALEVVRWIAEKTPTKKDDEIVAAFDAVMVKMPDWLKQAPPQYKILFLAEELMKYRFPGISVRMIRRAVEIAYGVLKP